MAQHSRAKKARKRRRWLQNVGDPRDIHGDNPNDSKSKKK